MLNQYPVYTLVSVEALHHAVQVILGRGSWKLYVIRIEAAVRAGRVLFAYVAEARGIFPNEDSG